jgi:hypothetical protein
LLLALIAMGLLTLLGLAEPVAAQEATQRIPFPEGSFVIPMDEKQTDLLRAFGLVHALLRNGGTTFSGGPILVWRAYRTQMDAAREAFPSVSVDTLYETTTIPSTLAVREPTRILLIKGPVNWGRTEEVLDDMGIPYDMVNTTEVEADPAVVSDYNLIVDDCPGWVHNFRSTIPPHVADALRSVATRGDHLIFTDQALLDMDRVFPGKVRLGGAVTGLYTADVHIHSEAPAQFAGAEELNILTMGGGQVIKEVHALDGRVVLDTVRYPLDRWDPEAGHYRIFAAYFFQGLGSVEGFAYHPPEQTEESYVLASVLYGNRFVHTGLILPPPPPPAPLTPVPLPATVPPAPPPPPPPALAIPTSGVAPGLAAGLVLLPVAAGVRMRADRLRPRVRVPVMAR